MKNTYFDLIEQSYYFPQDGFDIHDGYLTFHGVSLKYLIEKYGTPFRLMYLPRIGEQIKRAKNLFNRSIKNNNYSGKYEYCYCTKCCHFYHVVSEALKYNVQLETSSSFDIDLIRCLYKNGQIDFKTKIIHNGFKTDEYVEKIVKLQKDGFENSIIVLDSKSELTRVLKYAGKSKTKIKIGLRMAIDEESQSAYYTSRLGMRASEMAEFYEKEIKPNENLELKLFHFFIDSGIKDSFYYWTEFGKAVKKYIELKKLCPTLEDFDLGGGFPIRNQLGFEYDYEYIIREIVRILKETCLAEDVQEPNIITEFGKYTVGESGAVIFKVLDQKQQNDTELWYIIDNSLMTTIPDAWSANERFILLPINKWNHECTRVNIGGISCDHSDYYNSEDMNQHVILPSYKNTETEPLYIGFFHTGAYQDSIAGYGGIKHCLLPSPKHIVVYRDETTGNFKDYCYRDEQTVDDMFHILGYDHPEQNPVLRKKKQDEDDF
ncbi:MAG: arginine decarboxylase [Bacteroidales bacterium]|nr:arginine decarboxylase [Bacteroidales bacterium]MBQ5403627.1 arginine decarboxylase [Bacteroidales bacterium]MBR6279447.1 arginine decarboxylase [Bacteroidales bacterium]